MVGEKVGEEIRRMDRFLIHYEELCEKYKVLISYSNTDGSIVWPISSDYEIEREVEELKDKIRNDKIYWYRKYKEE